MGSHGSFESFLSGCFCGVVIGDFWLGVMEFLRGDAVAFLPKFFFEFLVVFSGFFGGGGGVFSTFSRISRGFYLGFWNWRFSRVFSIFLSCCY